MELKEDYKITELGILPKDWDIDYVKNHCSITTGDKNTQDRIDNGNFPFFVRSQTIERINSYSFDGEAVLTAGDGVGTGKIYHYINGKFDFHQRVYKMSNFSNSLDGYYFFLYFSNNFYNRISQMTAKSSVDSVRRDMIANMQIPVPKSISEQKAIAKALSDADAWIQSLTQLIAKKRQVKQGAMQNLLNPYENGRLKEGWKCKKLGDILEICHGKSQKDVVDKNGVYPILASGGEIGKANQYLYDKPSVLIGRKGTIDIPQYMDKPFWTIDTLFYSKINFPNDAKYIFYQFNLIDWYSFNEASGVPSLSAKTIESIEIFIPQSEEQNDIAKVLSDMDNEISNLEKKLLKAKQIKQGMMQNLLTGKIRLI